MKFLIITLLTIFHLLHCHDLIAELSPETIDSFITEKKIGFIMFYNPECPYSQSIKSVFNETAQFFHDKATTHISFARVNGEKHRELLSKFSLLENPSILWFDQSRALFMIYSGNTEMKESFIEFVESQLSFDVKEIKFDDWKEKIYPELVGKTSKVLIFVGDKAKHINIFNRVMNPAWNEGIKHLYWSNDDRFYSYYNIDDNKFDFLLFKIRGVESEGDKLSNFNHIDQYEKLNINEADCELDKKIITINTYQQSKVERLLKLFSHDIVSLFDSDKERLIVLGIPTLILSHNFELGSAEYDKMLHNYSTLAKSYRKEALFLIGSPITKFTQILTESFGLKPKEFPNMCMLSTNDSGRETIQKYKVYLDNKTKAPSLEILTRYVEKWFDNKLEPYINSEEIPTDDYTTKNNGILKLVGRNFYNVVMKPGYDVVLLLCHEKIEECKKFKEIYKRIVKKLNRNEKLLFTECNPYKNEINFIGYETIPGIVMFPDNDHKIVHNIDYKGKLTTRDIIDWIKEKAVHKLAYEDPLEDSEYSIKEETGLLKAINLGDHGIVNKLHDAVIDQEQYDLFSTKPDRDAVNKERRYINDTIYKKKNKHEVELEIKDDL